MRVCSFVTSQDVLPNFTGLHSNSGTVARMLGTVARTELAEEPSCLPTILFDQGMFQNFWLWTIFKFVFVRLTGRFTKKQQSGSPNGVRIGGHVMVHRTDIAGGSIGQTRSGNGMCRRAPNGAPPRKQSFARTSACLLLRRQELLPTRHDGSFGGPCSLSRTLGSRILGPTILPQALSMRY